MSLRRGYDWHSRRLTVSLYRDAAPNAISLLRADATVVPVLGSLEFDLAIGGLHLLLSLVYRPEAVDAFLADMQARLRVLDQERGIDGEAA